MTVILMSADGRQQLHSAEAPDIPNEMPLPGTAKWCDQMFVFSHRGGERTVIYRATGTLVLPGKAVQLC